MRNLQTIQTKYYLGYKIWDEEEIKIYPIVNGACGFEGVVSREDYAVTICDSHNENLWWGKYRFAKDGILFSVQIGDRVLTRVDHDQKLRWASVKDIINSDDTYYKVKFDNYWNTNIVEWFMIENLKKKLKL